MAMTRQQQIDALDAAMARGLLELRDGEKLTKYKTADEMLAIRAALVSLQKSEAKPTRGTPRYQLADFRDD